MPRQACTHHVEDDIAALEERVAEDVERQVAARLDAAERVPVADVREAEILLLNLEQLPADVDFDDGELACRDVAGEDVAL